MPVAEPPIDRGGVYAALYGTVALLPDRYRTLVRGFVVNKFRGDPGLLGDAAAELGRRCGVPTLGVLPWLDDVALDAEDSLALSGVRPGAGSPRVGDSLDVVAVRFPRMANLTDLDALALEPGVEVRLVADSRAVGRPDLVILPGTKATVDDLAWLQDRRLDRAIAACGALVLGICGGMQMMGRHITDHVESGRGEVDALGWLDVSTGFGPDKVTRQRRGHAMGEEVSGYQIHHGRVTRHERAAAWIHLHDRYGHLDEGAVNVTDNRFLGTTLHGVFESDGFRAAFLTEVSRRAGKRFATADHRRKRYGASAQMSFAEAREAQFDRLADVVEDHLDHEALDDIIARGAPA
ncbi:MAG: cobyric acid synthase [Acidimicrobiales bacterium]